MDNMYKTVQVACKMAMKAHNQEKRPHIIFKEVGLWRIKPIEEIEEIDQKAVYGWTVPKWWDIHGTMPLKDVRKEFPMGDDSFVRKQFYIKEGYYSPAHLGLKLRNQYTQEEIEHCILYGQNL